MFRKLINYTLCTFLFFGVVSTTTARNTNDVGVQGIKKVREVVNPNENILDVNNMTTWVREDGFFGWVDNFSGVNGSFPKSTSGVVFAQGVLWGGKVFDNDSLRVRVNGSTYANGLDPGKVLYDNAGNVIGPDTDNTLANYHVWRVHRNWDGALDYTSAAAQFFGKPSSEVTDSDIQTVRDQYENDWQNWPADLGAPFEDVNGNGQYEPDTDIPGYPGATQTIWIVANDLVPGSSQRSYGSPSIGMEMQMTLWGYDFSSSSPLGNITFNRTRLIYTGKPGGPDDARIDSMFVVQWADPDVGTYSDDYAGSDTSLSLGYAYNGNNTDDTYLNNFGLAAPAVGWDFFQGPVANGDTLGMTSFGYFAAGSAVSDPDLGEYSGTLQWYNLMRGFLPRPEYPAGQPWVNPLTGEQTKFVLTGDPVTGRGWIDGLQLPPGDRRLLLSTGPFTMAKGDTQDIVIAQIGALGINNTSSVNLLKYYDEFAQYAYDQGFKLPSPPPAPAVSVTPLDKKVVLNWGADNDAVNNTEKTVSQGFKFEGYNVYQLPAATSQLSDGIKIATYDKANLVGTILQEEFDAESGYVIEKPVQTGTNEGIQRYHVINQDHVRNRPLANGVQYHFAVTAYSYLADNEGSPFKTLESAPVVLSVQPQPEKPGTTEPPAVENTLDIAHDGASTSSVFAKIVDPAKLRDANYEIMFKYYNPYEDVVQDQLAAGDTIQSPLPSDLYEAEEGLVGVGDEFPLRWNLHRNGSTIGPSEWLPQYSSGTPESEAPLFDGLQVYVPFVSPGIADWTYEGSRWVSGTDWGGQTFFGGADIGHNFFGSDLSLDQLTDVVLEFQGDTTSGPADGWASKGAVYHRHNGYAYAGTGYLPFAAYEIDSEGNKVRQLNVSFVENEEPAEGYPAANLRWDMGTLGTATDKPAGQIAPLGGREYVFIHNTDYDEGATYDGTNHGTSSDVMYAFWPSARGSHPFLEADFTMSFFAAIANSTNDVYSFTSTGVDSGIVDTLKSDVADINVFPNPYYGFHKLETGRFDKYITFTHLPDEATIRIFNLAGIMVTKLIHNSDSQFKRWDLTNADGLPVASGIYIAHVDTPYGEKVLKIALVQEEQVLQRY